MSYTNTGLNPGWGYSYYVCSWYSVTGYLACPSTWVSATTYSTTNPNPPTGITAAPSSSTSIYIAWSPPSGGGPFDYYAVYRWNGGGSGSWDWLASPSKSTLSYTNTGLNPGWGYSYYVCSWYSVTGYLACPSTWVSATTYSASGPTPVALNSNYQPQNFPLTGCASTNTAPCTCGTDCCLPYVQLVRSGVPAAGGKTGAFNLIYQGNNFGYNGLVKPVGSYYNVTNLQTVVATGWAVVFDRSAPLGADAAAHNWSNASSIYGHIAVITQVNTGNVVVSQAGLGTLYSMSLTINDLRNSGVYLFGPSADTLVKLQ